MRELRVAVAAYEPEGNACSLNASILGPTSECPKPGYGHELLHRVFTLANISYELIPFRDTSLDWGTLHPNGTWTGLLGGLIDRHFDLVSTEYSISQTKLDYFDYSYPLRTNNIEYVIARQPKIDVGGLMLLVYTVFTWDFYLSFVVMMVLLFSMILAADYLTPTYTPRSEVNRRKRSIMVVVYNDRQRRPCGQKTLIVMASFLLFLVSSLYQACLLAKLLLPKPHGQISSLKELTERIESHEYTFITETSSYTFFENVNRSNIAFFKDLRHAVEHNPVVVEPNMTRLVEKLKTGYYVYQARTSIAVNLIADHCDLIALDLGQPTVVWQGYVFGRHQRSDPSIIESFNRASIKLQAYAQKLEERYTTGTRDCVHDRLRAASVGRGTAAVIQPVVVRPLSVLSLAGMGALLAAGCTAAAITFLAEKLLALKCLNRLVRRMQFQFIRCFARQ